MDFKIVLEELAPTAAPAPSVPPVPGQQNWAQLGTAPPPAPPPFQGAMPPQEAEWARTGTHPRSIARMQLAAEKEAAEAAEQGRQHQEAVGRERERQAPFDPAEEASKRVLMQERQEQQVNLARVREKAVQREVEALVVFDATEEAKKRQQMQREQEEVALKKQQREKEILAALEQMGASPYAAEAQHQLDAEREGRERSRKMRDARWQQQSPAEEAASQVEGHWEQRDRSRAVQQKREEIITPGQEAFAQAQDERDAHQRRMAILREKHAIEGQVVEEASRQVEQQREGREWVRQLRQEQQKQVSAAEEAAQQYRDEKDARDRRLEVLKESVKIEGRAVEEAAAQVEREREDREYARQLREEKNRRVSPAEEAQEKATDQTAGWQRDFDVRQEQRTNPRLVEEQARQNVEERKSAKDFGKELQQAEAKQDPAAAGIEDMKSAGRLMGQAGVRGPASTALMQAGQLAELPSAIGGLGSAGGLAAAAGPVGAALAVADAAATAFAERITAAKDTVKFFGDAMAEAASNRYFGTFNKAIDAAAGSLNEIPVVGKIYAAELQLAAQPIRSFVEMSEAFIARGRELSKYSGELAGATAYSDIRKLFADLKEADTLGPGLAALTDAQSRFEAEFRELVLPIKAFVVDVLTALMEKGTRFLENIDRDMAIIKEILRASQQIALDIGTLHLSDAKQHAEETVANIKKIIDKMEKDKEPKDLLHLFADLGPGTIAAAVAPRVAPVGVFGNAPPIIGGF